MKAARQPNKRARKLQKRGGAPADTTGVQKSTKRTSQEIKAVHVEDDLRNIERLVSQTNPTEMPERSTLDLCLYHTGTQTLDPRTKIKLQIFPVNEETRMALEKDGYNPHLELTLKARKKISSVLNHLINKWGCSSEARGELMLFPSGKLASLASGLRWTLNDSDVSAGDVYVAVGRPSIFRLRYGWVSTSIPFENHLPSEGKENYCGNTMQNIHGEGKQFEEMMGQCKSSNVNDVNNTAASVKIMTFPINPWDNEPPIDSGLEQSSKSLMLHLDSLTNISIGGLLSEASLMGKCSNWDSKVSGSNTGVQPAQVINDSLDACIAAQIKFSHVSKQPCSDQHSSIFDAEETCHAFPMNKFSSSCKDIISLDARAGGIFQDAGFTSKSFKFPKTSQFHSRSELPQELACKESKTDLVFCSRVYHDESSLGLSGIKWSDSLGPFDLGLPISRKASGGDSISMSGFVR